MYAVRIDLFKNGKNLTSMNKQLLFQQLLFHVTMMYLRKSGHAEELTAGVRLTLFSGYW